MAPESSLGWQRKKGGRERPGQPWHLPCIVNLDGYGVFIALGCLSSIYRHSLLLYSQ